ncbi:uncharacterized protein BO80DRAFT_279399 [Aspergillus ibericus CBS 121593]|uniref:Uncharacterized protein n=1 Tax=Aspergillus ibericus CBS 121593 TaxID=1448316 RepID=A0A395GIT5_9EURO|nr:hypothetical protein BO80DRAFT_279399 [Aspergillus ibericus CBS 121593]RAK95116.1 hypothetical protein BO80DRAFT_279399 [Aspergillus ibericus CBS 121593]
MMKKIQVQARKNNPESEERKDLVDAPSEAGPSTRICSFSPTRGSSPPNAPSTSDHSSPLPAANEPATPGVVDAPGAPAVLEPADAPDAAATTTASEPTEDTLALNSFTAVAPVHFSIWAIQPL